MTNEKKKDIDLIINSLKKSIIRAVKKIQLLEFYMIPLQYGIVVGWLGLYQQPSLQQLTLDSPDKKN